MKISTGTTIEVTLTLSGEEAAQLQFLLGGYGTEEVNQLKENSYMDSACSTEELVRTAVILYEALDNALECAY